jgi:hypothetical protein
MFVRVLTIELVPGTSSKFDLLPQYAQTQRGPLRAAAAELMSTHRRTHAPTTLQSATTPPRTEAGPRLNAIRRRSASEHPTARAPLRGLTTRAVQRAVARVLGVVDCGEGMMREKVELPSA